MKAKRIEIMDTTLRDGEQSPIWFDSGKFLPTTEDKISIVHGLVELGVRHIELFPPVVGSKELEDFFEIRKLLKRIPGGDRVILHAHVRCIPNDINVALKSGFDALNLYYGTSEESIKYNHGKNLAEIANIVVPIVKDLRKSYPDMFIRFSGEDAFRTRDTDIFDLYDKLTKYVSAFGTPDTVGVASPEEVSRRVSTLKNRYPDIDLEGHFQNDRGFALINALAAVKSGIRYIDASIWGIAERSGITSITALLFNLAKINRNYVADYKLGLCYPLNVILGGILETQVPFNEPVSLSNRTHIAGVHQKGVLGKTKTYEAHALEKFGVTNQPLMLII
jgi:homocitrate synthase